MTALIYLLDPKGVIIGTDTLSLGSNKSPHNYLTKVYPLPHLKSIICGTGSADLAIDWFSFIHRCVVGKDITILRETAQARLNEIFSGYNFHSTMTATIYQFGYNLKSKKFEGYRYHSEDNFKEVSLPYKVGIKPYGEQIIESSKSKKKCNDQIEFIIDTIKKQKQIDDRQDDTERLGIGGHIHVLTVTKLYQILWEVYEFSDYEKTFLEIVEYRKRNQLSKKNISLFDAFQLFIKKLKNYYSNLISKNDKNH